MVYNNQYGTEILDKIIKKGHKKNNNIRRTKF